MAMRLFSGHDALQAATCSYIETELKMYASSVSLPEMQFKVGFDKLFDGGMAARLVTGFLQLLRKTEVEEAPETKETEVVGFSFLDGFLSYFCEHLRRRVHPWFGRFVRYKKKEVTVVVRKPAVIHKHYHLIPADLNKTDGDRFRFMYWGGKEEYYDGLPGEWEALKELEQVVRQYYSMSRFERSESVYLYEGMVGRAISKIDRCRSER